MTTPDLRFWGRPARAGRPPLFGPAALAGLAAVLIASLAGCFGGGEPLPMTAPSEPLVVDARGLADLAQALREAKTVPEQDAVRARALRSAGVAPIADGRVPGGVETFRIGEASHAGWIVGRQPVRRDTLVVVSAPRDGTSDLALTEAARLLVARSVYTQTPERSVLIVLGDPAPALRFWDRSRLHAVLRVGAGPDSLAGRPVQRLATGEPGELALRLYRALVQETTPRGSIYAPATDFPTAE